MQPVDNKTIREYALGNAIEIPIDCVRALFGPGVYIFVSPEDKALYVGSSKLLAWRAFKTDHEANEAREKSASMLIIPCRSVQDARELEQRLIYDLIPEFNKRGGVNVFAQAIRSDRLSNAHAYMERIKEARKVI